MRHSEEFLEFLDGLDLDHEIKEYLHYCWPKDISESQRNGLTAAFVSGMHVLIQGSHSKVTTDILDVLKDCRAIP